MKALLVFILIFSFGCKMQNLNGKGKNSEASTGFNSPDESPRGERVPASNETWQSKFPSLFSTAYAQTNVRPEDVTYERFLNDLKARLKVDQAFLNSVKGPMGPQGEAGPIGPTGPRGLAGPIGQTGPAGVGFVGPAGPIGPRGEPGLQGNPGPRGFQGIQGIRGEKGDQGDQGLTGPMGPKGDKGDVTDITSTGWHTLFSFGILGSSEFRSNLKNTEERYSGFNTDENGNTVVFWHYKTNREVFKSREVGLYVNFCMVRLVFTDSDFAAIPVPAGALNNGTNGVKVVPMNGFDDFHDLNFTYFRRDPVTGEISTGTLKLDFLGGTQPKPILNGQQTAPCSDEDDICVMPLPIKLGCYKSGGDPNADCDGFPNSTNSVVGGSLLNNGYQIQANCLVK